MQQFSRRQATTPILLTLAVISLAWYGFMLFDVSSIGHPVAYGLLVFAEIIGMIQLLGVWLTVIIGKPEHTPYTVDATRDALRHNPALAGKVVVLVPVCGEPIAIIGDTLRAAKAITFPHDTYVLDDGRSDDVKALALSLGIGYVRRGGNEGWKAGNLNNALRKIPCDFFAVFDSDHVAKPEFLLETLSWILADSSVAFVQTPQFFRNSKEFVSGGTAEAQSIFYRHIQPSKNCFNSAFCVGTNVLYRTKAIMEIGGIYDQSRSEDIWTSLLLHERGWKSVYLPTVLATGLAPDTVDGLFRQQFRWASGGYEILFKHNPLLSSSLTLDQKLQYFHTAMFFMTGFSTCIFFILPLLYVYFGWKPIDVQGSVWVAHFLPYFVSLYLSVAHLLGKWPSWKTFVVSIGTFVTHIAASIAVLTGLKVRWSASGAVLTNIDYVKSIMVQMLFLLLSVAAIPVLLAHERNPILSGVILACLVWNVALLLALCRRALPAFNPGLRSDTQAVPVNALIAS